jgi:hypothetical protein
LFQFPVGSHAHADTNTHKNRHTGKSSNALHGSDLELITKGSATRKGAGEKFRLNLDIPH